MLLYLFWLNRCLHFLPSHPCWPTIHFLQLLRLYSKTEALLGLSSCHPIQSALRGFHPRPVHSLLDEVESFIHCWSNWLLPERSSHVTENRVSRGKRLVGCFSHQEAIWVAAFQNTAKLFISIGSFSSSWESLGYLKPRLITIKT